MLIHGCSCYAHDGAEQAEAVARKSDGFSFVQPFDDKIRSALKWDDTELANTYSDILAWGLAAAPTVVVLRRENEDRGEKLAAVLGSQAIIGGATELTKNWAGRMRPNGQSNKSFFSGHTSTAFAGASASCYLEKDYCISGYTLAAAVGYLRIAADRHWASDVIVGALVGSTGQLLPAVFIGF